MRAFTTLTFATAAIATPLQDRQSSSFINLTKLYTCNGAPYGPLSCTCYDGQLCPVINDRRQEACGDAYYDPALYGLTATCTNNTLVQVHAGTFSDGAAANTTAVPASLYPSTLAVSGGSGPSTSGAASALAAATSAAPSLSSALSSLSAAVSSLGAIATSST